MAKKKVSRQTFDKEMKRLQIELCTLQDWVVKEGLRIVVVFEGRKVVYLVSFVFGTRYYWTG